MLDWNSLQSVLLIAIACSTVTVSFIQKTKKFCKNSRCITWYSFIVNIIIGILFSLTFTNLNKYKILWVGLFGFIGADTIYRNLEGKLSSYSQLNKDDKNDDKKDNNSNSNKSNVDVDDVIGEIHYD